MREELILVQDKNIVKENTLKNMQDNFLKSNLGEIVNSAIDIGIKAALPDLIEDEVINIKDVILENGFKEGVNEAIKTVIDFGKSAIGIITGNFEDINQIDIAVKKGGLIDTVSDLLDKSIKTAESKDVISKSTASLIKKSKNNILDSIENSVENNLKTQVKNVEKIKDYSEKWRENFKERDFEKMSKNFKNIEKYLKETIPLENTINEARKIENLHNLIKNNGQNFNLTEEEIKLAEKLVN